jgi:hypothetical protein
MPSKKFKPDETFLTVPNLRKAIIASIKEGDQGTAKVGYQVYKSMGGKLTYRHIAETALRKSKTRR